jgi:hypothetical protein
MKASFVYLWFCVVCTVTGFVIACNGHNTNNTLNTGADSVATAPSGNSAAFDPPLGDSNVTKRDSMMRADTAHRH